MTNAETGRHAAAARSCSAFAPVPRNCRRLPRWRRFRRRSTNGWRVSAPRRSLSGIRPEVVEQALAGVEREPRFSSVIDRRRSSRSTSGPLPEAPPDAAHGAHRTTDVYAPSRAARTNRRAVQGSTRASLSPSGGSNPTSGDLPASGRRSRRSLRWRTIHTEGICSARSCSAPPRDPEPRRHHHRSVERVVGRRPRDSPSSCRPVTSSSRRTSTAMAAATSGRRSLTFLRRWRITCSATAGTKGETWGREVKIAAAGREKALAIPRTRNRLPRAAAHDGAGASPPSGRKEDFAPRRGGRYPPVICPASLVQAGTRSFLLYSNYDALLAYNCAHTYTLSVGDFSPNDCAEPHRQEDRRLELIRSR